MKKMMMSLLVLSAFLFSLVGFAGEKPITKDQLPQKAQSFIEQYYPAEKISYSLKEDDFFKPDYQVLLTNGVKLEFKNSGELKSIESRSIAIPDGIIPPAIISYIKTQFPDTDCREYEIDKRGYEISLSNRLELKFNKNFQLVELDD